MTIDREEMFAINLDHIGKKIKYLRLRQQKTQQQIADECGISKSLLSKIENGQTSSAIATLAKIAKALNVSLSWLLEDKQRSIARSVCINSTPSR